MTEIFGYSMESIYFFGLILGGCLTLLFIFLGDLFDGIFPDGILSPTTILAFLTFLSASGYLFEKLTVMQSIYVLIISLFIALICVLLLHYFVLVPLASAEESLVYREEDLVGRIGKVITTIPIDGFGEVFIEGSSGTIAKTAQSIDNVEIQSGNTVIVVDIKKSVLLVSNYQLYEY